jgi:hypothetical protein
MIKTPTDTHMILFFHFFCASSSPHEKRSFSTQSMRNTTATMMKKFLIPHAIARNIFGTVSSPLEIGE